MSLTPAPTVKGTLSPEDVLAIPFGPGCFPGLVYPSQTEGSSSTNLSSTSSTKGTLTPA